MIKKMLARLSIFLLIIAPYSVVANEISKITIQDCRLCGMNCTDEQLSSAEIYNIRENNRLKKLISIVDYNSDSRSYDYSIFLLDAEKCRHVLSVECHGLGFQRRSDSPYPDISFHYGRGAGRAEFHFYSWDGNEYNNATAKVTAAMNREAVQLIKSGEIEKASEILQFAAQAEGANAEVMNNYGYSMYLLAKQEDPAISYYKEARIWLEKSLKSDPNRWSAHLNLGDLFYDNDDIMYAIKHYRKLLEIKPDYEFAKKIKDRIDELILIPSKIGDSTTGKSTGTSMSTVTYTRLEDRRVERKEYFNDGKLYAVHHLRDGYADGEYIAYWSYGGRIRVKGQFAKGIRIGKFIYYDEKGPVTDEVIYDAKKASTKLKEDENE